MGLLCSSTPIAVAERRRYTRKRNAAASRSLHTKKHGNGRRELQKGSFLRVVIFEPQSNGCRVQIAAGKRAVPLSTATTHIHQRNVGKKGQNGSEHCLSGESKSGFQRLRPLGPGGSILIGQTRFAGEGQSSATKDGPGQAQSPAVASSGANYNEAVRPPGGGCRRYRVATSGDVAH